MQRPFDPTPEAVRRFIAAVPLYRDDDDPTFWPDERLRERQDHLLRRQMGWLAEAGPHYRRMFAEHGIDAHAVQTLDDLVDLPVTTKQDLMADPQSFRLRFAAPTIYDQTYATVFTTGTTSGKPTPYEYTGHDFLGVLMNGRRSHKTSCLVPGDRYLSLFPLSPVPHVSSFNALISNAAGVLFLHGFAGTPHPDFPVHHSSAELLDLVESVRPQTVSGIGSFLRRLFADAASAGRDLSSLEVVSASGEVLTARMREHMRDSLARAGATTVMIGAPYGFTEGGVSWAACHEGGPLHACSPDQVYLEVLDPTTHARLPDGEPGLVAITHLNRRGMPLLRYLLGDISAISNQRCERCGRGGGSLLISTGSAHVSRTSELMKVKGTLVNPQVIHDVVMSTEGVSEYQLVVTNQVADDPLSPDKLVLRVGLDPRVDAGAWNGDGGGSAALRAAVFNAIEVRPVIEVVCDLSEIYDPGKDFKARRILDQRRRD